jgi:hypothetical protein
MKRTRRALAASITAVSLGLSGAGATWAAEGDVAGSDWMDIADRGAAITADLLFLRPLGTLRALVGAVAYVPSVAVLAPYSAIKQDWSDFGALTDVFILEPVDYAFQRPLGVDLAGR